MGAKYQAYANFNKQEMVDNEEKGLELGMDLEAGEIDVEENKGKTDDEEKEEEEADKNTLSGSHKSSSKDVKKHSVKRYTTETFSIGAEPPKEVNGSTSLKLRLRAWTVDKEKIKASPSAIFLKLEELVPKVKQSLSMHKELDHTLEKKLAKLEAYY